MTRARRVLTALITIGCTVLTGGASSALNSEFQSCPPPITGIYINDDHGYVFAVPAGLAGRSQSPCTDEPDGQCSCLASHGLQMLLPEGGVLSVYSSFTAWLDHPHLGDLLREQLWRFGDKPALSELQIVEVQKTKIMGESAFWIRGIYTGSDGEQYMKGMYVVLLNHSVELLIQLTAKESGYAKSLPMLKAVVTSLRPPTKKEKQFMRGE
jgi:hypothetical protein